MSQTQSFRIQATTWRSMVSHAESCYPCEACGAVLGRNTPEELVGTLAVEMRNKAAHPERDYELDPEEIEDVERKARRLGLHVLAFYHSHPDAPPEMSMEDLRLGCPLRLNIILSIRQGQHTASACYAISSSRIAAFVRPMRVIADQEVTA